MSTVHKIFVGVLAATLSIALVEAQTPRAQTPKPKTTTTAKKPYSPAPKPVAQKPVPTKSVTKTTPTSTKPTTATTKKKNTVTVTPAPTPPPTPPAPAVKSTEVAPVNTPAKPTPAAQPIRPAKALSRRGSSSSFGLRIGGTYASVTPRSAYLEGLGASGAKLDFLPGFEGAIALNLRLGRTFSIQPEVQFSQWGLKASVGDEFISTRTNYLMVPLSLRLTFGDQTRFFIQGGGFGSYALSSRVKIKAGGAEQSGTVDFNDVEFSERASYGAGGGAGVIIPVGKSDLILEGRYQYVLGTFEGTKSEIHPTAISFSVGYFFPL
ncbi:MAG: PorT family protein [Cytophagaceae bacterium]|nr:PorT family protein [Cytophagaceae bacterium]